MPVEESKFEYKGILCVVRFQPLGFRCGYIGLPKDTQIDSEMLSCHCGVTWISYRLPQDESDGRLWVGFDCGHSCDGYDIEKLREYYGDNKDVMTQLKHMEHYYQTQNKYCEIRTLEFVESECRKMVDQYFEMIKG